MKKFLAMVLTAAMAFSLVACGGSSNASSAASEGSTSGSKTDVAFVTDVGNIDDQSFNQYTWQGVKDFCAANNLNANYYRPTEDSDSARLEQMDNAVNDGAKAIVVAGYLFEGSIAEAQTKYPDVQFVVLDVSSLGKAETGKNVALITYREEQVGYLAGYAAVYDGYKKLGFLGGMAVPAVQRYGFGFVQGANAAAVELGTPIEIKYTYGGQFFGDASITAKMEGWYSTGTEIVFACGGGIYTSAVEAALAHKAYVIGVDVDQYYCKEAKNAMETDGYNPFVTSAMTVLQAATENALDKFFKGEWAELGGKIETKKLETGDYVGLPTGEESWGFKSFTIDEYNKLVEAIRAGEVVVSDALEAPAVDANVTVTYID